MQVKDRAGIFVTQPSGYKSFVPKGLPPVPPVIFDAEMISLLSKADSKLGRLDGVTQTLPNAYAFWKGASEIPVVFSDFRLRK